MASQSSFIGLMKKVSSFPVSFPHYLDNYADKIIKDGHSFFTKHRFFRMQLLGLWGQTIACSGLMKCEEKRRGKGGGGERRIVRSSALASLPGESEFQWRIAESVGGS
jgi:hypothetical protein